MKYNDKSIIRSIYTLRKETLQRVMTIAETETRLESLLNVLKFTSTELQKFEEMDKSDPQSYVDYIDIVTQSLRLRSESQTGTEE